MDFFLLLVFREPTPEWLTGRRFFCDHILAVLANRGRPDITGMRAAWSVGDRVAVDRLIETLDWFDRYLGPVN